jgi:predicted PurR-regulated permease PerM
MGAGAGSRLLLMLAALVVVVAGLKAAESVIVPVLFAAFMAIISAPLLFWLQRKRVPSGLAVTLVVVGVVGAMALIGTLLGTSVTDFTNAIPTYRGRLSEILKSAVAWAAQYNVQLEASELLGYVDPGQAMGWISSALASVAALLSNALFVVLTMVFILLEAAALPRKLRVAMDDPEADLGKFSKIATEINSYLVIKTLVSLGTGLAAGLSVWAIGVDFPFLWGLVAFLLNFIPNIGSIIAAAPPILLALVQYGGGRALAVTVAYTIINLVMGNVIEPHFMGRRLGLSSLVVFLSLVVWGWVWGPIGMLLSVPLTMIVKILLENSDEFRGIAVLLGPDPPEDEPAVPRSPTAALRRVLQQRREDTLFGDRTLPPRERPKPSEEPPEPPPEPPPEA